MRAIARWAWLATVTLMCGCGVNAISHHQTQREVRLGQTTRASADSRVMFTVVGIDSAGHRAELQVDDEATGDQAVGWVAHGEFVQLLPALGRRGVELTQIHDDAVILTFRWAEPRQRPR